MSADILWPNPSLFLFRYFYLEMSAALSPRSGADLVAICHICELLAVALLLICVHGGDRRAVCLGGMIRDHFLFHVLSSSPSWDGPFISRIFVPLIEDKIVLWEARAKGAGN